MREPSMHKRVFTFDVFALVIAFIQRNEDVPAAVPHLQTAGL